MNFAETDDEDKSLSKILLLDLRILFLFCSTTPSPFPPTVKKGLLQQIFFSSFHTQTTRDDDDNVYSCTMEEKVDNTKRKKGSASLALFRQK